MHFDKGIRVRGRCMASPLRALLLCLLLGNFGPTNAQQYAQQSMDLGTENSDESIMAILVPPPEAPSGFPPFPAQIDLPVSLAQPGTELNKAPSGRAAYSQSEAVEGEQYLHQSRVVDGFKSLKLAVELNKWRPTDQPNAAQCHLMMADILLEYAFKAKENGNGTKGMQRLLNAWLEYRQALFLDPSSNAARSGMQKASQAAVQINGSFNNILALGSSFLLTGDKISALNCYNKCAEFVQNGNTDVPPQLVAAMSDEIQKLGGDVPGKSAGSRSFYVDDYVSNAQRALAREWRLSHIQTTVFPAIAFAVDKRGNITELRVTKSSGDAGIDEIGLNVARRVAPFPEPPSGVGEISYTFEDKKDPVDLTDYMRQLRRKIRHNWHPPHDLQEDHIMVSFRLLRDGSVEKITLAQQSASEARNKSSLDAVKNAAPFQHLPDSAPDSVDIQFHFDHDIETSE